MTDRTRAHVYVSGKVQGMYFRATTRNLFSVCPPS